MKTRIGTALGTIAAPSLLTICLVLNPTAAFADDSGSAQPAEQSAPAVDRAINSAEAQQEKAVQVAPDQLPAIKVKAAEKIAKRQADLAAWAAKLNAAPADCGQNAAALARIAQTQASITALSASIAAATTPEAAKPLYQQIFTHNRVYAVVSPVVHLTLACDQQWARAAKQTTQIAELQAKIAAANAAGTDTSAASAFLAQVAPLIAAGKQSAAAASASVVGLVPDQGNETTKAANAAAIAVAREQIKGADTQLDSAANLLSQTRKALGGEVKSEKKESKEAERARKKAEKEAEKAKKQAEREAKKASKKKGSGGDSNDD